MQGLFGLGLGDALTAQEAVSAAYLNAFNKLSVIPLYRSHTIYNSITHKYNSLKVRKWLSLACTHLYVITAACLPNNGPAYLVVCCDDCTGPHQKARHIEQY